MMDGRFIVDVVTFDGTNNVRGILRIFARPHHHLVRLGSLDRISNVGHLLLLPVSQAQQQLHGDCCGALIGDGRISTIWYGMVPYHISLSGICAGR